jgi:hypothetical protein
MVAMLYDRLAPIFDPPKPRKRAVQAQQAVALSLMSEPAASTSRPQTNWPIPRTRRDLTGLQGSHRLQSI